MMKRFLIYAFVLITYSGISQADGLNLSLHKCMSGPAQITDIEFISPHHAFITTQVGDVYWFRGCNKPAKKIGHINVALSDWRLGLYSIAVPHDFFWSHTIYMYFAVEEEGYLKTRLSSFKINLFGDKGLSDENVLMEIDQPYPGNEGGALTFGPDGLLYLGVGDGGFTGDPHNNAQNIETILGSIVRIDPDPDSESGYRIPAGNLQDFLPGALPELFAYGVNNPWRFGFSYNGSLIIGDVGDDTAEEIDIITKEMINHQEINLGWNTKEGNHCFNPSVDCSTEGLIDPVYQYEHGNFGNAVTGGETYVIGDKEYYIFADFMTGMIGVLDLDDPTAPILQNDGREGNWVTFARTPFGQVYIADYAGDLYRVILR